MCRQVQGPGAGRRVRVRRQCHLPCKWRMFCGWRLWTERLFTEKGYKVVGFDFSEEAVEIAKDRAKKSGVERDCEFFQADALNLDKSPLSCSRCEMVCLPSGRKFQTILDSACLQCFDPKTQNDYINNIAPLLEGGGALVLLVAHVVVSDCLLSLSLSVARLSAIRVNSEVGAVGCDGWRTISTSCELACACAWQLTVHTRFCAESGWMIKDMLHTVFLENIPMVRINKGVRSFEPVTPSPCLRMVAVRPVPVLIQSFVDELQQVRSKQLQVVVVASVLALAAGGLLLLLRRRAGAR
eukprot:768543-Hanusia_phi.AAC.2